MAKRGCKLHWLLWNCLAARMFLISFDLSCGAVSPCYKYLQISEGSLEVKCPAIWTAGKYKELKKHTTFGPLLHVQASFCAFSKPCKTKQVSARLPHKMEGRGPKTTKFCETSSMLEVGNIKNEAILRDFFQTWRI